jgi:phenylacetate-CoA ligase
MYNYFNVAYELALMIRRSYWTRKRIAEYQMKQIRRIAKNAYDNVPFYHQKFKKLGITASDIKTVEDLNKVPILRRKEIVDNIREMISERWNPVSLRVLSTSGSTGRPMSTYLNRSEDEFRKAKHLRANIAVGQRPMDRWVVVTAPHHFAEVPKFQRLLGIYAAIPLSVFAGPSEQLIELQRLRPQVLDGYSSSLFLLAKELTKHKSHTIKPKLLIGGAELIDPASRRFIEKSFEAQFYDQYATVEFERLAWQCKEKMGYHIDSDSVVMQFVDENDEEVHSGESGQIVCTSLFNTAMPLIRYATGDIGRASEDTYCDCGRTFPLMQVIEGRKDSMLVLSGGRTITALALGWAMEFFTFYSHIEEYRVTQKRIDLLEFLIKKKSGPPTEKEMEAALSGYLRKSLNIKEELSVKVEFTNEIPLESTGKLRKVISELQSDD